MDKINSLALKPVALRTPECLKLVLSYPYLHITIHTYITPTYSTYVEATIGDVVSWTHNLPSLKPFISVDTYEVPSIFMSRRKSN